MNSPGGTKVVGEVDGIRDAAKKIAKEHEEELKDSKSMQLVGFWGQTSNVLRQLASALEIAKFNNKKLYFPTDINPEYEYAAKLIDKYLDGIALEKGVVAREWNFEKGNPPEDEYSEELISSKVHNMFMT
eukprot:UN13989